MSLIVEGERSSLAASADFSAAFYFDQRNIFESFSFTKTNLLIVLTFSMSR